MKKKIFSLLFLAMLSIIIIGFNNTVKANSISSIDMDIYVDNEGNAEITEVWKCNSTSQTE